MRRANVVSGAVLAILGLVILLVVIPAQIEPGPPGMMSPRLVPSLMMGLVTGLSVLLAVANLRAPADDPAQPSAVPISGAEVAALFKLGAVFAVALALYALGSPLAAGAALIAGALLVLGERRPLAIVLMPAGLLLALWLLFYKVLGTAIV